MKNKLVKILVLAMSLVVAFSTTACKGKGNKDKGNRVQIEFRTNVPVDTKIPYIGTIVTRKWMWRSYSWHYFSSKSSIIRNE